MEYITVREVSEKWGITARQVQSLCDMGKIEGAIRFNRCWAIPNDAQRPVKERNKAYAKKGGPLHSPGSPIEIEYTLSRFASYFPYPMQIMTPDGIFAFANEALQEMFQISDAALAKLIGRYNILKHPLIEKWGVKDDILRLFQGEPVQWKDMKAPLQEISDFFGDKKLAAETIYQDIIAFPVYDDFHRMAYVVIIYITSRLYSGKEEIKKGREYIEEHWREKFDLEAVAKASGLSRSHFEKLFKTHTGLTPHNYYFDVKIMMLQKKIKDSNLSISQAFEECGMEYNSHYVGIFKKWTGMTPMEYRKNED